MGLLQGMRSSFAYAPLLLTKMNQYHGQMPHEEREKSLNGFQDNPEAKILIASLKCGGVGLNLTMASKVICLDLGYNSGIEQQGKGLRLQTCDVDVDSR